MASTNANETDNLLSKSISESNQAYEANQSLQLCNDKECKKEKKEENKEESKKNELSNPSENNEIHHEIHHEISNQNVQRNVSEHQLEDVIIDMTRNLMNRENQIPRCSILIDEHLQEIQNRINMHTLASDRFQKYDRAIGYHVTIISSFVASALMVGLFDANDPKESQIVGLVLSITSFILSVSRDYLNYSRRHNDHNISAKLYTNLLRSIEIRLINNHIDMNERRDIFRDIVDQMSIIEQYELPIPNDIDKRIRSVPMVPRSTQLLNCV